MQYYSAIILTIYGQNQYYCTIILCKNIVRLGAALVLTPLQSSILVKGTKQIFVKGCNFRIPQYVLIRLIGPRNPFIKHHSILKQVVGTRGIIHAEKCSPCEDMFR